MYTIFPEPSIPDIPAEEEGGEEGAEPADGTAPSITEGGAGDEAATPTPSSKYSLYIRDKRKT